ncbi:Uncharacterized protein APZ42_024179 [Daphnia magna]|uniref:Uncharacterized protein n=1 Tax=Daphnia magna TaxID=35525 RepID=A0A0P4YRQ6_9CRUS|nr:Uncharacterized protein APZ42_024179 [Daphnia magna]
MLLIFARAQALFYVCENSKFHLRENELQKNPTSAPLTTAIWSMRISSSGYFSKSFALQIKKI